MKHVLIRFLLITGILCFPIGCTHQPAQAPIPGSINAFDSGAYQTLRTAHDIAASLSSQACSNNGNKPGCFNPSATQKVAINQFINDLNIADQVYSAYHQGLQTQAAAQAAINTVQRDQAALPSGIGK